MDNWLAGKESQVGLDMLEYMLYYTSTVLGRRHAPRDLSPHSSDGWVVYHCTSSPTLESVHANEISTGISTGTTTSFLCVPSTNLCPHNFWTFGETLRKFNREGGQAVTSILTIVVQSVCVLATFKRLTGILTKMPPNFLKKKAFRGFRNPTPLSYSKVQLFFKSLCTTMMVMPILTIL